MSRELILFVSHDASATGAPVLLLHLLRWLRANTKLDFKVALNGSGPLEAQFSDIAPTIRVGLQGISAPQHLIRRLAPHGARASLDARRIRKAIGEDGFALVYSNTVVNGNLLRKLPDQRCPVISHIHELQYVIDLVTTPTDLEYVLRRTDRFIAASAAVARNLSSRHGVDGAAIDVLHEFIPCGELDRQQLSGAALRLRTELRIPPDAVIVGGAGTVHWRKGYDLFILLASEIGRRAPGAQVHFVWVGDFVDPNTRSQIDYDLSRLDLGSRVHFVGYRNRDALEYLAMFDVLCLMSREDPFPLVMLECAALGKPIICFDQSGGGPEFVESDGGFVVPYMDLAAMALRVVELVDDTPLRERLGRNAETKVRTRHDVAVSAPRIAEIIERSIREART